MAIDINSVQRTAILYDGSTEQLTQGIGVNFYRFYDLVEPDDTLTTEMNI